ncbi:Putative odorant receptor 49a, partial [Atta colombica]
VFFQFRSLSELSLNYIFDAGMKMIDKRLQTYRTYQRFTRILLTICGCWYMPTKSDKSMHYYSICVLLTMIMMTMVTLHTSYIHRHNLGNMMKNVGFAITGLSAILKVISFTINRGSLINYHRILNDLFEEELMRNDKIRTIIFSSLHTMYILTYGYFALATTLLLLYFAPSYLLIIRGLLHFHLSTNYTLPISRGYGHFWTVPDNFLYHLHLVFETTLTGLSGLMACSVDSFFGFYVYQFTSTMRAMNFRLTNPLPTEKFLDLLRMCVAKHQRLLRCRDTLEHVYGPIVFWHIVTNAILLCGLMYDAMPFSDFKRISMFLTYAVVKFVQTFTYAWYGTVLTNASEDFRNGIYFGEWFNSSLDHHVRTNVILIMMQKPITINAIYSPVNITIFTNVSI